MSDYVSGYQLEFQYPPYQESFPRPYVQDRKHNSVLQVQIDDLVQEGVVTEVFDTEDLFVSNIFLRPKKDGSFRMIIDLSELDESVEKIKLKLDTLSSALDLLYPGAFLTSVDLKDAYHLCKGVEYGLSHYKEIEKDRAGNKGFEASMYLSREAKKDLEWWHNHLTGAVKELRVNAPKVILSTDASSQDSRHGSRVRRQSYGSRWSEEECWPWPRTEGRLIWAKVFVSKFQDHEYPYP